MGYTNPKFKYFKDIFSGEGDPGGGYNSGTGATVRETIFSSEICSVEYQDRHVERGDPRNDTILFDDIGKQLL